MSNTYSSNYITIDFLTGEMGLVIKDKHLLADVPHAIYEASRRVNFLTGNKIDANASAGANPLLNFTEYQQKCIQRATAGYVKYYLTNGFAFIRGSNSGSTGGQSSFSQSAPEGDPDYIPRDVIQELRNAGLLAYVRSSNIDGKTTTNDCGCGTSGCSICFPSNSYGGMLPYGYTPVSLAELQATFLTRKSGIRSSDGSITATLDNDGYDIKVKSKGATWTGKDGIEVNNTNHTIGFTQDAIDTLQQISKNSDDIRDIKGHIGDVTDLHTQSKVVVGSINEILTTLAEKKLPINIYGTLADWTLPKDGEIALVLDNAGDGRHYFGAYIQSLGRIELFPTALDVSNGFDALIAEIDAIKKFQIEQSGLALYNKDNDTTNPTGQPWIVAAGAKSATIEIIQETTLTATQKAKKGDQIQYFGFYKLLTNGHTTHSFPLISIELGDTESNAPQLTIPLATNDSGSQVSNYGLKMWVDGTTTNIKGSLIPLASGKTIPQEMRTTLISKVGGGATIDTSLFITKVQLGVISGRILTNTQKIGTATLNTTAKDLSGATNELLTKINALPVAKDYVLYKTQADYNYITATKDWTPKVALPDGNYEIAFIYGGAKQVFTKTFKVINGKCKFIILVEIQISQMEYIEFSEVAFSYRTKIFDTTTQVDKVAIATLKFDIYKEQ